MTLYESMKVKEENFIKKHFGSNRDVVIFFTYFGTIYFFSVEFSAVCSSSVYNCVLFFRLNLSRYFLPLSQ